jgi:MerR family transcriptional regulator, copper efflux regulator
LEGQASNSEARLKLHIGDAARRSGVSAKLIRYYESRRLLSPTGRDASGYRVFDERNVHELRLIKRARALGFPIKQIDELLKLWRDKKRSSRKVRVLAVQHRDAVAARMEAHRAIIDVLSRLIAACKGDERPDCPILDELGKGSTRAR